MDRWALVVDQGSMGLLVGKTRRGYRIEEPGWGPKELGVRLSLKDDACA